MEKKSKKLPIIIAVAAVLVIAVVVIIILSSGHRVIKVNFFEGAVNLERNSDEKKLVEGMNLKSKDKVTTGAGGLVELLVDEDKHILAQENTCFKITASGNEKKGKLKIELKYGTSLIEIENKLTDDSSVELETPNATLSVRGTTFETTYNEGEETTVVKVTDGAVKVESEKETEEVQAGYMATVKDDEIKIEALPFEYRDEAAFEARYSVTNEYSGIKVKELVGWTYNSSTSDGTSIDVFENKGVKIRYWVLTEAQVNEWIEDNSNVGWTQNLEYLVNGDGETIICEELQFNGDLGNGIEVAYQYYKELQDNMYLSIMVYDEDGGVSLGDASIETYLPLTMNCYYMYSSATEPNASENTGMVNESVGASIGESEWPQLLKGGSNYSQLEHMLRIAQIAKNDGHTDYLKTALYYMCYEVSITNVYEPVSLTAENNGVYDIAMLNNMYSFLSDETIGEQHLNPPSTISGNQLTCVYTPTAWEELISSVTISNAYYGENGEIIVEFIYYKTDISAGSVESNNSTAHLVQDEDGKYVFGYIQ